MKLLSFAVLLAVVATGYALSIAPLTDSQLCSMKCTDCGCSVKNGEAECDCTPGPNHPLIKPPPPTQRERRTSEPEKLTDTMICQQKCQPDCGCTVNDAREAVCDCSAANNPLIKRPIPPPPPRPVLPTGTTDAEDDGTICRHKCPADCGCLVNAAREATCDCSADNHPLIKRPARPPSRPSPVNDENDDPSFECMPPQCEDPCYLFRPYDPNIVCLQCKCP